MKRILGSVLIILCMILTGCSTAKENWAQITAEINVAEGGQVAVRGDSIYYIDDQQYIWQCDSELTKGNKIITDKYIYSICTDDNALYYTISPDDTYEIRKYDFKSKQISTLIVMENRPHLLSCWGENLVYLRKNEVFVFDLHKQVEKCVVEGTIETFTCASDGLYYVIKDTLLGSGTIYHKQSFDAETTVVCKLPNTMYPNLEIDNLFVTQDTIYVRLGSAIEEGFVSTSTSYQINKTSSGNTIQYSSIDDIQSQFPAPNDKGHYYLMGLGSDETARAEFQRFYPEKANYATYLASFNAGRLAFSPNDSEWVDEILTDHTYYSSCYYSEKGLILNPCYADRKIFFGFD